MNATKVRDKFETLVLRDGSRVKIDLHKLELGELMQIPRAIEIERPVSDVFAFFKDFENFPRVFGGLRSVIDYENGLSHWEAYSPSGAIVAWIGVPSDRRTVAW